MPVHTGKLTDPIWRQARAAKAARARTTPEYHLTRLREFAARRGVTNDDLDALTLANVAEFIESDDTDLGLAS